MSQTKKRQATVAMDMTSPVAIIGLVILGLSCFVGYLTDMGWEWFPQIQKTGWIIGGIGLGLVFLLLTPPRRL